MLNLKWTLTFSLSGGLSCVHWNCWARPSLTWKSCTPQHFVVLFWTTPSSDTCVERDGSWQRVRTLFWRGQYRILVGEKRRAKTHPSGSHAQIIPLSCELNFVTNRWLVFVLQEENVAEKETQDEKPVCKDVSSYNNSLILSYEDAPNYLKFNPYIRSGYRGYLTTKMCLERYDKFIIFLNFKYRIKSWAKLIFKLGNLWCYDTIILQYFESSIKLKFLPWEDRGIGGGGGIYSCISFGLNLS